jgi:hypothetical protein
VADAVELLRIYRRLVGARIRSQLQYRLSFALNAVGTTLITFVDFAAILVIFGRIDALGHWSIAEVAFLYAVSSVTFGLADLVIGHLDLLPRMIRQGDLDVLLARPLGSLFQVVSSDFALRRLGKVFQGLAVLAYALVAGPLVAFDVDVVVGALDGSFAGIAVVSGLLALAVAAAGHGLAHLGGAPGIAAAVLTIVLLGLSSSGGAVGYQFEPGFYGAVSQLLPPGAAVTAVRNVRYFDWAATLEPLVVLGAWALGGLVVGLLAERIGPAARRRPPARRLDVAQPAPVPA